MPNAPTPGPSLRIFAGALLGGLGWGIAGATVIAAMAAVQFAPSETLFRQTLEVAAWTAMFASILAVFPVAPVAGVVGWQLYRRGVIVPVVYAALGALSALLAPLLVVVVATETMRYPATTNAADFDDGVAQMVLAGIAVAGAFGGFMAGRALRRNAQT